MKPILIHVPHSSLFIPEEYRKTTLVSQKELDEENSLMCDTGVLDLIPQALKSQTIVFPYSRLYCDVERLRDGNEPMEAYGMGYIYTRSSKGNELFRPSEAHKKRINEIYESHHSELNKKATEILNEYGKCLIIDLHSFSEEMVNRLFGWTNFPDICIGTESNHYSEDIVKSMQEICDMFGLSTELNYPYSGSIVPSAYYGRRGTGIVSVMIEINKRVLLPGDEECLRSRGHSFLSSAGGLSCSPS